MQLMNLDEAKTHYLQLESPYEFNPTASKLNLPVNLNIFEKYYKTFKQFKYLDEYSFIDKTIVFNAKDFLNNQNFYPDVNLFPDLKYLNSRIFTSKNTNENHGIKTYIDWTTNNHDLYLSNILKLDLTDRRLFVPIDKNVYLNYDYYQSPEFVQPAYYFLENSSSVNYLSEIEYGKLKPNISYLDDLHADAHKVDKSNKCSWAKTAFYKNYLDIPNFSDAGYEGICDVISVGGQHYAFNDMYVGKWTTPYMSNRFFASNYWTLEYYYYSLGDFSPTLSRSKNLLNFTSDSSKIWFVNFDDVFELSIKNSNLYIDLNKDYKLIDIDNFMQISSIFSFDLSFYLNNVKKIHSFSMKDVLNESIVINLDHDFPILSRFEIVAKNTNDQIILSNSESGYSYRPKLDFLLENGNILSDVKFDDSRINNYFPSQFLNFSFLKDFFKFISNTGKTYSFDESDLKSLDVRVYANDDVGELKIFYIFDNNRREILFDNLPFIPDLTGIFIETDNLDTAIVEIKKKFPTIPDIYWNNINFIKSDLNSNFFNDQILYHISIGNSVVKNSQIFISNSENIAPVLSTNFFSNKKQLSDLFEINSFALSKNLDKSDYLFSLVEFNGNNCVVNVSLKNSGFKKLNLPENYLKKTYVIPASILESLEDEMFNLDNLKNSNFLNDFENLIWGAGGTLFGGGLIKGAPKILSLFKKWMI